MNDSLRNWDNDHVWHPFTPMQAHRREETPIITDADGFYLIDDQGKRYIDAISSLWCNVHGHRVPEIDQAIKDQIDRVSHSTMLGLTHQPGIELARKLVEITPEGLNNVFFSDSGSTAVEAGLKIAFQYHHQKPNPEKRDLFIRLDDAYHGDTIGSVSVGGINTFHEVYGSLLFATLEVPAPIAYRVPEGYTKESYLQFCFDEVERVIKENSNRVAAFVIEPLVQGAAGILIHPEGYLKHVRELTQKYDIPLIADEVAVGFGRTGTMFACEQEDVIPDIMCLAKGLTGGYLPVAATIANDELFNAFLAEPHEGKTFYHGHTFTGNPLGCAAALANLELFETNNVIEQSNKIAKRLTERLEEIQDWPNVGEIRQKGTMLGIELVKNRETKESFETSQRLGHQVVLEARKRGLIIRPLGDVIVLMPAPAMPTDLIDTICDITWESISTVVE